METVIKSFKRFDVSTPNKFKTVKRMIITEAIIFLSKIAIIETINSGRITCSMRRRLKSLTSIASLRDSVTDEFIQFLSTN